MRKDNDNNKQHTVDEFGTNTHAVRTGTQRSAEGEHSDALFLTSSFVFADAAEAAGRFSGDLTGNIYSRFTNPTVNAFEKRLAAMEEGECCIATASGMSAIMSICMALLRSGDHIVSSQAVFGTTVVLFDKVFGKFGINTSWGITN